MPTTSRTIRRRRGAPTFSALPMAAVTVAALALALAAPGCERRPRPLAVHDLNPTERTYVTRLVVLERVKAAVLVDPRRGAALGDSLVVAWGDSARERTALMAPADPARAVRVHDLLLRLFAAEHDSLLRHGGLRPLEAPLPAPADSVPGAGFPAASRVRAGGD